MTEQEINNLDLQRLLVDEKYFSSFQAAYNERFNHSPITCLTCPGIILNAINRLKEVINKKIIMGNSVFKIKGGSINSIVDNKTYNNDTITDEAAIAMIKENENFKAVFELPENFKELMSGKKPEQPKTEVLEPEQSKEKKPFTTPKKK